MAYKRKTSTNIGSKIANRPKRFVRYEEGAEFYSLGIGTFERLAKEAGALYKINRIVLVNLDIVDEYMVLTGGCVFGLFPVAAIGVLAAVTMMKLAVGTIIFE